MNEEIAGIIQTVADFMMRLGRDRHWPRHAVTAVPDVYCHPRGDESSVVTQSAGGRWGQGEVK